MRVVGLMSGTSYDAIDVAIADFSIQQDLVTLTPLGATQYPLPAGLEHKIGKMVRGESITAFDFCELDTLIGQAFADVAASAIESIADSADLICSHGQTIYHWEEQGRAKGSLQIGNPAWIAERTGVPVVADVRVRDIAAGGNGAPLVSTFDVMLAREQQHHSIGFLNLGGIANMTVVQQQGDPIAYDLGPANTLIDAAMVLFSDGMLGYDQDGARAAGGEINNQLLDALQSHPYYALKAPKSTGKETFGNTYLQSLLKEFTHIDHDDVLATLTAHVGIVVGAEAKAHKLSRVVASGGGLRNTTLVNGINRNLSGCEFESIDSLGVPSDAKEAYAFALLGYLTACGFNGGIASCTGATHDTVLGSITPASGRMEISIPDSACQPTRLRIAHQ